MTTKWYVVWWGTRRGNVMKTTVLPMSHACASQVVRHLALFSPGLRCEMWTEETWEADCDQ